MAQNYGAKYLKALDERWHLTSKTKGQFMTDARLEFAGVNSVTIYTVDVVAENDYTRSGSNRFGALVELGTGTQTMTLSQDKAFTFTVDRGNLEDSMFAQEIGKAVKRQTDEVSIPNTDIYNLGILTAYAIANSQGSIGGTAAAYNTIYSLILVQQAALDELKVPDEGRTLWITPTLLNLLKRDPEFMKACDETVKDLKKGIMGTVDGLTIVKVPASYLVTKFEFMITHKSVAVPVEKFNSVRVLNEVQGIDGSVAEGRRYHDFFIYNNKATGIRISTKA